MAKRHRLKRTRGGAIILPGNKTISVQEQRRLRNAVRTANRMRKAYFEKLPPNRVANYNIFGQETDFIHRKKSAGFSRFRNRSEFVKYLHSVEKIASGYAAKHRAEVYRENYKKALRAVFGDKASLAARKAINKMSMDEFVEMVENDKLAEIGYVYYDPDNSKLTKINLQLGVA